MTGNPVLAAPGGDTKRPGARWGPGLSILHLGLRDQVLNRKCITSPSRTI
jgi:hypothetical protein